MRHLLADRVEHVRAQLAVIGGDDRGSELDDQGHGRESSRDGCSTRLGSRRRKLAGHRRPPQLRPPLADQAGRLRARLRRGATGRGSQGRAEGSGSGTALALAAFLDGIPEQLVLGIGIASGQGVGVSLLVAIFVSNLPEALGSASDMSEAGRSREAILRLWLLVAVICAVASLIGYLVADTVSGDARAAIDGFAAGALLVMLIDSMIPDARNDAGRSAGLITVLGFAVAAGLSSLS
ncbi:MAG TPA: ZIP family metal transporter [Solirubrobacterales bacterium]